MHKTSPRSYKINPLKIPRPTEKDIDPNNNIDNKTDIDKNINSDITKNFETKIGILPPPSTSFFSLKETQNSSFRFLRMNFNKIIGKKKIISSSSLPFSLLFQPFAELPKEEKIEKYFILEQDDVLKCPKCGAFVNNKFCFFYDESNNKYNIAVKCNICLAESIISKSSKGFKEAYISNDINISPIELKFPTIDYLLEKKEKKFTQNFFFFIDISQSSFLIGLSYYAINSIFLNIENLENTNNIYLSFALYDKNRIYFLYFQKDTCAVSIMKEINDPYCPLPINKISYSATDLKENKKIKEKIFDILEEKNEINIQKYLELKDIKIIKSESTITGSAIKSGIDALSECGGRIIIFTSNYCSHGYAACKETKEEIIFYKPQHYLFDNLAQEAINKKIVVDQFIFLPTDYPLSTFSIISNKTGGEFHLYSRDNAFNNSSSLSALFEKLHSDLFRLLSRDNVYGCELDFKITNGLELNKIIGPFGEIEKKNKIIIGGCDPDYCLMFDLKLTKDFLSGDKADIQIIVNFTDKYGEEYIRVYNLTYTFTESLYEFYKSIDIDALTKSFIYKKLSLLYNVNKEKVKEEIEKNIFDAYYFYISKSGHRDKNSIIIPYGIKYLPLYMSSLIKKGIFYEDKDINKSEEKKNERRIYMMSIVYKLMREPIYHTIKYLYPKLYIVNNIEQIQEEPKILRLSKDLIDFDSAYLSDDGEYLNLFIYSKIFPEFLQKFFGFTNFEEAKKNGKFNIEDSHGLNKLISLLRKKNFGKIQPLRVFLLYEGNLYNPFLIEILVEDEGEYYINYPNYLFNLHNEIIQKLNQ